MYKKLTAFILALSLLSSSAYASILGGSLISHSSLPFGGSTELYQNTFLSDQTGVGLQTEYYAEYKPNTSVLPVVVTGESIWGKRTISEAINYMKSNNMYPMIGINASFFSFKTGVPMGHVITNGEITSKDTTTLDAVGFDAGGHGFVSRLGIKSTAYFGDYEFDVAHINKYYQATTDILTLFTDKFGKSTMAEGETINVILGNIQGTLGIGKTVSGTVEDIRTVSGAVDIPDGKMIMTINTAGNEWVRSVLNLLTVGETITVKSEATVDGERWNNALNGLASEGKTILKNGEVTQNLEAGAAPRTAVGITGDGSAIFYVIDGRQKGYSYGVKQSTLAERLKELGCVDALNLDGGGSTSIAGVYPGQDAASIINSPSEGTLRKVTNFIFLQNMQQPTNTLGKLYLYPYSEHYLSGSSVQLYPAAVDSALHYMDVPEVTYSMENDLGSVTQDGVLTLSGTGEAKVRVTSGAVTGEASYFTYAEPTSFSLYNIDSGEKVTSIKAASGSSISLGGHAYHGKKYINSTPSAYTWQIDSQLGTAENGVIKLTGAPGSIGNLTVWSGNAIVTVPVAIEQSEIAAEPAERYPYNETLVYSDKIQVDMYSYNEHIDFDNSYVSVDGEIWSNNENVQKYEVDDRHALIVIPVDENFEKGYHKILVKTQTTDGYTSLQPDYVKNSTPANGFSDTGDHWARDVIAYMNNQKVVNGSDGKFYPDNNMTRAEFAVMMCNYLDIDVSMYSGNDICFDDKSDIPSWALDYVKAAAAAGFISGKQDGDKVFFAPSDNITRAEAASIIARTLPDNLRKGGMKFTDTAKIPMWAVENMQIMTGAKFMNGYPDNTIRPAANVTRAEAVSMLYNVY